MSEVLSATNLKFLAQGMWTTLYLSFFIIVLSTLFGTILAVMRNGKESYSSFGLLLSTLSSSVMFLTCFGFSLSSWSSNSSQLRQGLHLSRSLLQLPWRKSFVGD